VIKVPCARNFGGAISIYDMYDKLCELAINRQQLQKIVKAK